MPAKKHTRRVVPRPKKGRQEYFLWCDESGRKGSRYSDFFGGVLVTSDDLQFVYNELVAVCKRLRLFDEIKWNRVSASYLGKYMAAMDAFFELVKQDKIKVRIMFTKNGTMPLKLKEQHPADAFFTFYYYFIKQAFGFALLKNKEDTFLRIYFDHLPDSLARRNTFIENIIGLQSNSEFQQAKIKIRKKDITEVDSKKHLLLQLMDVVLGSMFFRLNEKHIQIPTGQIQKSNRTIAKEKLYNYIISKIRVFTPGFRPGVNTGIENKEDYWRQVYRHGLFKPIIPS